MKQNLLSQVLQIIASDKSLVEQGVNVGDIQNHLNNIIRVLPSILISYHNLETKVISMHFYL